MSTRDPANPVQIAPTSVAIAINFLEQLRSGGPWILTAILPDGPTATITARDASEVEAFIGAHNNLRNIYYSAYPTRTTMTQKAAKTDIARVEYLPLDLDPKDNESPVAAKARYLTAIERLNLKAAAIIDSGNGIQVLVRLDQPLELAEPVELSDKDGNLTKVFPPETSTVIKDVEARTAALVKRLGSVAGAQNIDRILRLPGTTNLPNKSKREKGRTVCHTRLLGLSDARHKLEDFPKEDANSSGASDGENESRSEKIDWEKVAEHAGWLKTVDDLPNNFSAKGKIIVGHSDNLKELNVDLDRVGLLTKPYNSWSDVSLALAAIFKADGRFNFAQIAAALMSDLPCNRHVMKMGHAQRQRAVDRLLNRSYEPKHVGHQVEWRECNTSGAPRPSMHNASLAITKLGVECRHDTFHDAILFGFQCDSVRHELQALVGEVTDNGILRLRQLLSDHFGVDFKTEHTRDAVVSLALAHCFDPVCDMLDKAQAEWDEVRRLDALAVTHFNCDDSPLNRAIIKTTMIAAVRRAREPGCKFDNITVLEGTEGFNKSSIWRVLAGDENFSDVSILGANAREVQEQLAGVWIHENADLAGMKKAEIEEVKSFASRQVDIARPAYGRLLRRQKRHSIEVGSTNSDQYLLSQTGNRRFWPLTVRKLIDLAKVARDRMQLWGEAATLEAAGASITLDEKLWPLAACEQEQRRVRDPWEDVVAEIPTHVSYDPTDGRQMLLVNVADGDVAGDHLIPILHKEDGRELVASSDLLKYVLQIPSDRQTQSHSMRLATVMRLLGWERTPNKITIQGKQLRGYFRWLSPAANRAAERHRSEATRLTAFAGRIANKSVDKALLAEIEELLSRTDLSPAYRTAYEGARRDVCNLLRQNTNPDGKRPKPRRDMRELKR